MQLGPCVHFNTLPNPNDVVQRLVALRLIAFDSL
jgi:hypothetical protein